MNISIYGSHDGSVCYKTDKYHIIEAERFFNKRYSTISQTWPWLDGPTDEEYLSLLKYIKTQINEKIETVFYNQLFEKDFEIIKRELEVENFVKFEHHYAHAIGAYYQSPFTECYVISFDGGGENLDGTISNFTIYYANNGKLVKLYDIKKDLGTPYEMSAEPISCIRKGKNGLANSGKLMGLCSFGKPIPELIDLSQALSLNVSQRDILEGQLSYDFAATSQLAFEMKFFGIFNTLNIPFGSNICLTGGCALNIILNQKLCDLGYKIYVPPNPNDCGLTFGALVGTIENEKQEINLTYAGLPILDTTDKTGKEISNYDIANMLYKQNKILGYIEGNSECGPRALGNRSILCYPETPGIKDKLNAEIKFREWFRPFGGVVRLDNLDKYFYNGCESRYMSFSPTLRTSRFGAVTHVDGTCRVQTVTGEQHSNLYDILGHIESMGGEGVLLNTSFNIRGKPILTRLEDAFVTLRETKLDGFVHNNRLYCRETIL
jgi:carbamoyltransferase